jgi:hypothetical protein
MTTSTKFRGPVGPTYSRNSLEFELAALAAVVLIGGLAMAWSVIGALPTPARAVSATIASCESYAARHNGSTAGC